MTTKHKHDFVEQYDGLIAFGLDDETDRATVKVYLQKIADDDLLATIIPRLTGPELTALFDHMTALLADHLSEPEYHRLFLK